MEWNKKKCLSIRMNPLNIAAKSGVDQDVVDDYRNLPALEIGNGRDDVLTFKKNLERLRSLPHAYNRHRHFNISIRNISTLLQLFVF